TAGMGDEGTTDGGFRAAAEVAVGAQQSAENGPPAFCVQTVGEDRGQQHSRKFLAEVINVDVWARGAQPQDERHIRRLPEASISGWQISSHSSIAMEGSMSRLTHHWRQVLAGMWLSDWTRARPSAVGS
ncbi:uncharacterized protein METZ01_LOCUS274302, partial [marine metagenome]